MNENEISRVVVDIAVKIHKEMGPGLLETVYEVIICDELRQIGLEVERQVSVPICFRNKKFEEGFRADVLVEGKVILELKSVEKLSVVHKKQLLTYLRLSGLKLGILLNFGEALMRQGIKRIVNDLEESLD